MREIISQLPENGRLSKLEELILQDKITVPVACVLLHQYPPSGQEVMSVAADVKAALKESYGLEIPDYELIYQKERTDDWQIAATIDWLEKKIYIPPDLDISLPITLAHELGHAYHAENSAIFRLLKSLNPKKKMFVNAKSSDEEKQFIDFACGSFCIREGWANFVAKLYARARDERLGRKIYETLLDEKNDFIEFMFVLSGNPEYGGHAEGCFLFEKIHKEHGFDAAVEMAKTLISDGALRAFHKGFTKK